MERINKYNEILGLKGSVNAEELKKLYRSKAKILHPDRNSHPSSHEQFLLLQEAFSYYNQLLDKIDREKYKRFKKSKKYPSHYYNERHQKDFRMAARKKAAERIRKKYAYFEKMGYDKTMSRLFLFWDILHFALALVVLIGLPVFLFFQEQFLGLIMALIVQFITYSIWSKAITRFIPSKG